MFNRGDRVTPIKDGKFWGSHQYLAGKVGIVLDLVEIGTSNIPPINVDFGEGRIFRGEDQSQFEVVVPKKISLEDFNAILEEECEQFGVVAELGLDGNLGLSGGGPAMKIAEQLPQCTEKLHKLLQQYEIDPDR